MKHIYWGFGKGKTSTLNGSAIRAIGADMKVLLVRFLKGRKTSEDKILINAGVEVKSFHTSEKFTIEMNKQEIVELKKCVQKGIKFIKEKANNYDLVLLDEIIDLVYTKIITEEELIVLIKSIDSELMMSGHYEFKKIFYEIDLITHYEAQKHYFDKGLQARKGIEK